MPERVNHRRRHSMGDLLGMPRERAVQAGPSLSYLRRRRASSAAVHRDECLMCPASWTTRDRGLLGHRYNVIQFFARLGLPCAPTRQDQSSAPNCRNEKIIIFDNQLSCWARGGGGEREISGVRDQCLRALPFERKGSKQPPAS